MHAWRRLRLLAKTLANKATPHLSQAVHYPPTQRLTTPVDFDFDIAMASEDSEIQPLLPKPEAASLPKAQMAVILFARLAEPIAYTQIFPYINAMVEEFQIAPPNQVGFYSGLIISIFAIAQLCTITYWGVLSDRIGRKPVVLIGLFGVLISTLCFGLSNTLWQLLLARSLSGALCGNVAIVYSIVSDITGEDNRSRAFALIALIWWTGVMIGSVIGGMLSHPVERYPKLFGNVSLLKERPFFLPCFVSVVILATAMLTTLLFMEESLPRIAQARESTDEGPSSVEEAVAQPSASDVDQANRSNSPPLGRNSTLTLLMDPVVAPVVFVGFCMSFLMNSFTPAFVLWTYTPLRLGGLQLEPAEIGLVMSVIGTLGIATSTVGFPYLHARFKSVPLFTACIVSWGVAYALIPLVELVVWKVLQPTQHPELAPPLRGLWGLVFCILVAQRIGSMGFSAYMLVVKEAMPDPASVGTLFGLANAAFCLGEGTAPAIASSLFALSIDRNLLGGNLVWVILIALATFATWFASGLKHPVEVE